MKNINLALVLFLFLFLGLAHPKVYAQAPGITYQAVIMSPDGKALPGSNDLNSHLADQEICLRFSFKNAAGENEYEEVIQTKTDAFGMVNVIIGTGNRMGGSATSFGQIKWSNQSKFLDVALDKNGACSEFVAISTQQFTAVPFALFAANSGNTGPMGPAGPPGASGAAGLRGQAGTNGLTASTATFVDLSTDQSVGGTKIFTNPITGSLTGNAGTATLAAEATKLATARTINGIPFDGSASITLPANAESITGIVPIAKGGTNSTAAATAGGVGYGTGTAHAYTITGTAGQMLSSTGAGTPTWVAGTVPYTGATGPVNLGGFDLKANGVTVGRGGENVAPNTAIGFQTLRNNTTGQSNTAIGYDALRNNTTGPLNTGTGKDALYSNTTGSYNNANGVFALYYNIDGNNNNALGMQALFENKTGDQNTALGTSALGKTLVSDNTAVGYYAGNANTSGANNSFVGTRAGGFNTTGANNTFIGGGSNTTEGNTLSNATALGAGAIVAAANTIQLGNTSVTSVKTSGTLTAGAITYPNTAGAANAVLTTDGSGVASWNAPSASGVPYMGATGAVNLGGYDLAVNGLTVGKGNNNIAQNTAIGTETLQSNTTGLSNTAVGYNGLKNNLSGSGNTTTGYNTLLTNTTGSYNTATGFQALFTNTTGMFNTATGGVTLFKNKTGWYNTAIGNSALENTLNNNNTAVGYQAGKANTAGTNNSFVGTGAGKSNTTGANNTFIGGGANTTDGNTLSNATALGAGAIVAAANTIQLGNTTVTNVKTSGTLTAGAITYPNTAGAANSVLTTDGSGVASWNASSASGVPYTGATGAVNLGGYDLAVNGLTIGRGGNNLAQNTAVGVGTLLNNTGQYNTAVGYDVLKTNTSGQYNTAIGYSALRSNTTGPLNTATGRNALFWNTTGAQNNANGAFALYWNVDGNNNSAQGFQALFQNKNGSQNTALGNGTLEQTKANDNTAVGFQAGKTNTTGANNTFIGNGAEGSSITESNVITLGNSAITTLRSQATSITALSDRRDKTEISTINEGLDFIMQLKPVSFTWNTRDKAKVGIKSAGFIAQDLLALQQKSAIGTNLDLVSQENPDKLEARYGNLLPVIVKAIQEEKAEKDTENAALKAELKLLEEKLKLLEARLKLLEKW